MPSLRHTLTRLFGDAFERAGLDRSYGIVEPSQRPELGQFQCNGALPAAKAAKRQPREIAQQIVDALEGRERFKDISLAGPGFINATLTDEALAEWVRGVENDPDLGVERTGENGTIVMDYGGPNVAKSMHVGHLRSSIIGDSLNRLLRATGHHTVSDIHLGDWGLQMGQLVTELQRRQPELPYFDAAFEGPYPAESPVTIEDLEEIYPVASARCTVRKEDPPEVQAEAERARNEARAATAELQAGRPGYIALWRHFRDVSIAALRRDFGALGVQFDLWYGESDAGPWLPKLEEQLTREGYIEESEGARVIHLPPAEGEREVPPLIFTNRDGGVGYHATDLATVMQRVHDFDPVEILYIVDQRQATHFDQVFRAARRTGVSGRARMEHLGFGTMNGPDGRPFKTRAGGVLKLADLLSMAKEKALERMSEGGVAADYTDEEREEIGRCVGIATIKYADLMNHRTSNYIFDLEKFTSFEGRTGAYLLYNAVRCRSVLRKAAERGFEPGPLVEPGDRERDLYLTLSGFAEVVAFSAEKRAPNYLCDYLFTLAQEFSRFFAQCHIITEENAALRSSWLALTALTLRVFERGLGLLGIEIPERM